MQSSFEYAVSLTSLRAYEREGASVYIMHEIYAINCDINKTRDLSTQVKTAVQGSLIPQKGCNTLIIMLYTLSILYLCMLPSVHAVCSIFR